MQDSMNHWKTETKFEGWMRKEEDTIESENSCSQSSFFLAARKNFNLSDRFFGA